jgi:hypothetical protein
MNTNKAEFGEAFLCNYDAGRKKRQEAMDAAIADARLKLPKGMVFEIRAKIYPIEGGYKSFYGRQHISRDEMATNWGIAWYLGFEEFRTPAEPLILNAPHEGTYDVLGGFVLLARLEA